VASHVDWSYRFPLSISDALIGEVFITSSRLVFFQGRYHKGDPLSVSEVFITELLQKPAFLGQPANYEICHGKDRQQQPLGCHDRIQKQEQGRVKIERVAHICVISAGDQRAGFRAR
jgi:hypothetical protein